MIVGPTEADSPYDTLAPAVAQMEALAARIVSEQSDNNGARIDDPLASLLRSDVCERYRTMY